MQNRLQILKDKKQMSRFFISVNNVEKYIDGFVLDITKEFVLLRECVDFESKGLVIIEISNIIKLKQGKSQKSFTRIFKLEKLTDCALSFDQIPLENYSEIFKAIKKKYKYAIVENAYNNEIDFCIGEIVRVNKASVSILYFDITGKVNKSPSTIPFKDIINIEFDSNYINTFIKFLK